MANKRRTKSALPGFAAAVGTLPLLAPAVSALSPGGVAWAAGHASLQSIAQAVARGEDTITPAQLQKLILAHRRDFTLIDIRSPEAFAAGHISGAENIPLTKLFAADVIVRLRRSPQVVVYAQTTDQEAQAGALLRVAGVPALELAGGLAAWAHGISAQAAQEESAAIVRALNTCPQLTPAAIRPLTAKPAAPPSPSPAASPAPAKKKAPINLNGLCG